MTNPILADSVSGVDPTGTTDSWAGLQGIISNLTGTNPAPVLLQGTYRLSQPLVIDRSNVTLVGPATRGAGILKPMTGYEPEALLIVGNSDLVRHCTVEGLAFDGGRSTRTTGHGIIWRCGGGVLKHVRIDSTPEDALRVEGYADDILYESFFEDIYIIQPGNDGIYINEYVYNCDFIRPLIHGGRNQSPAYSRYGIYEQGVDNKILLGHPYLMGSHGLLKDAGRNLKIIGGEYENNDGYGISVVGASDRLTITGGAALYLNEGGSDINISGGGSKITINGVDCRSAISRNISLFNISDFIISNAQTEGATSSGIWVGSSCNRGQVSNTRTTGSVAGIRLDACTNVEVSDNVVQGNIVESTGADTNRIHGNYVTGTVTQIGSATKVWANKGFATEASGTATVADGATSVTVTHNLAITPSLANIRVTPTNDLGNAAKFWVSNPTSTQFTINVDADPGADTATFAWSHLPV